MVKGGENISHAFSLKIGFMLSLIRSENQHFSQTKISTIHCAVSDLIAHCQHWLLKS